MCQRVCGERVCDERVCDERVCDERVYTHLIDDDGDETGRELGITSTVDT